MPVVPQHGYYSRMETAQRRSQDSERRDAVRAMLVVAAVHAVFLLTAVLTTLHSPSDRAEDIVVSFEAIPPAIPRESRGQSTRTHAPELKASVRPRESNRASMSRRESATQSQPVDAPAPEPDAALVQTPDPVEIPAQAGTPRALPHMLSRDLTAPAMTDQQAFDELLGLLERHPEYRNLILREMFAGDGRVPGSKWMLEARVGDVLKFESFLTPYQYELMKSGGGGYTGPYDPVHGFDRDKRKGFLVNVPALLKFLKTLIGIK